MLPRGVSVPVSSNSFYRDIFRSKRPLCSLTSTFFFQPLIIRRHALFFYCSICNGITWWALQQETHWGKMSIFLLNMCKLYSFATRWVHTFRAKCFFNFFQKRAGAGTVCIVPEETRLTEVTADRSHGWRFLTPPNTRDGKQTWSMNALFERPRLGALQRVCNAKGGAVGQAQEFYCTFYYFFCSLQMNNQQFPSWKYLSLFHFSIWNADYSRWKSLEKKTWTNVSDRLQTNCPQPCIILAKGLQSCPLNVLDNWCSVISPCSIITSVTGFKLNTPL